MRLQAEAATRREPPNPPRRTPARRRTPNRRGNNPIAYLFLAPFLILFGVFVLYPFFQAVGDSFYDFDLLTQTATNFGTQNYVEMLGGHGLTWSVDSMLLWRIALLLFAVVALARAFTGRARQPKSTVVAAVVLLVLVGLLGIHPGPNGQWNDPKFWMALRHTIEFTVFSTPVLVALGLLMAMAVNRPGRTTTAYRTMFFLPYVLPVSVVTLIWIYFLDPSYGLFSAVTDALGIKSVDFLNSTSLAMIAIIVTTVWWTVGFNMIIFLAGLQDIDANLYEAASLDGAGRWAKFRFITIPGLRPVTLLVLFAQVVGSFQIFGQVYLMTQGGPGNSTIVLIQDIYQTGIRDSNLGYASAQSVVLVLIILLISVAQLRFMRQETR